jgi:hypothetical protein
MCYEKIFDTGSGATDYILSRGNQNSPYPLNVPDSEGSDTDGQISGSDFEPESVCCSVPF